MSVNVLQFTEQFNNAYWTPFDGLVVTPNSFGAPTFAGTNAGLADTIEDTSAVQFSSLFSSIETIPNDSSDWIASIFIRKDTNQSRFLVLQMGFRFGSDIFANVQINTETGVVSNADSGPPDASGSVDVDANWWRLWLRRANDNTGNSGIRMALFPAYSATAGGAGNVGLLGSFVAWGANITNDSILQTYQPNPSYAFDTALPFFSSIGAKRIRL